MGRPRVKAGAQYGRPNIIEATLMKFGSAVMMQCGSLNFHACAAAVRLRGVEVDFTSALVGSRRKLSDFVTVAPIQSEAPFSEALSSKARLIGNPWFSAFCL